MHTTEQDLRHALRQQAVACDIDVQAALTSGRRSLTRRRLRKTGAVLALPVLLTAGIAATTRDPSTQLVGSGLTLAAGSTGPVQVSDDRVDLGDGIQAWRDGEKLYIGYPVRPNAVLDTGSINSGWGDLGYDTVVFDDEGEQDGSTIVVGTVRGAPRSVSVTVDGITSEATIACFVQAEGWCSYKANVPTSIRSYANPPQVVVR